MPTTCVVCAALAGLVPEPLADQITGDPPTEDSGAAAKQAVLERLDEGRVASYWQLLDALEGVDYYTLRVALELQDDDQVQTEAVFWRRDRVAGVDAPVEGVVGEGGAEGA